MPAPDTFSSENLTKPLRLSKVTALYGATKPDTAVHIQDLLFLPLLMKVLSLRALYIKYQLMKWFLFSFLILCTAACGKSKNEDQPKTSYALTEADWQGHWITTADDHPKKNAWLAFRSSVELEDDLSLASFRIAVDSKYWLWINGRLVVMEGGLKRGPAPKDTYYDEVPVRDLLKKGENSIAVLVWYFGKEGMTHKSSGKAGMIAELHHDKEMLLMSDGSWKAMPHPSFIAESSDPQPNWRLPESNIVFDARRDITDWTSPGFDDSKWPAAKVIGQGTAAPWGELVERPVPFWKDFGLKSYAQAPDLPFVSNGDTVRCRLPYNAQVTPFLSVEAEEGKRIVMLTDHYKGGSEYNMRAEYITKNGEQHYESPGWINGHTMYYIIPDGVRVLDLKYRETGYDTEFAGNFECDNPFYNLLWKKARRTLYITMRDNYMDCPDRERAQWWGDVVLESGEAFYALDRQADALMRKGMLELMNWQRQDGTIFSPIPAGNWNKELPGQMLASVGYYGFWNYYLHTGDLETIRQVYGPVKRYLDVWGLKEDGTVKVRQGGWTWGDWGENRDVPLLMNTQYYLALKSLANMAEALDRPEEAGQVRSRMEAFRVAFNEVFWTDDHYRSPNYKGATDDRSQGLAVVAGLVGEDKYKAIYNVLNKERHASPYMEKYILEALFQMGYEDFALRRMKERFDKMVTHPTITTLWEGWGIGAEGFGGGTTNHAWSGGGLTLLSQYVAGVSPVSPGYTTFRVRPQPGALKYVKASIPSIKGIIQVEIKNEEIYTLEVQVPEEATAYVHIPAIYQAVTVNNKHMDHREEEGFRIFEMTPGRYIFEAQ